MFVSKETRRDHLKIKKVSKYLSKTLKVFEKNLKTYLTNWLGKKYPSSAWLSSLRENSGSSQAGL